MTFTLNTTWTVIEARRLPKLPEYRERTIILACREEVPQNRLPSFVIAFYCDGDSEWIQGEYLADEKQARERLKERTVEMGGQVGVNVVDELIAALANRLRARDEKASSKDLSEDAKTARSLYKSLEQEMKEDPVLSPYKLTSEDMDFIENRPLPTLDTKNDLHRRHQRAAWTALFLALGEAEDPTLQDMEIALERVLELPLYHGMCKKLVQREIGRLCATGEYLSWLSQDLQNLYAKYGRSKS